MALSLNQTIALQSILKPGMRVASMGYPDIIAPPEFVAKLTGGKEIEYRADSAEICKRHGMLHRPIPDAESLFKILGCNLEVFDIVRERGCEIIADLNRDWGKEIAEHYDIVLDVGTAEHCFNIGQALINMAGMVKEGGYIIHENPFNCGNHGFYSLNPTLFADFYAANGFKLLDCRLVTKDGRECKVPHTQRFKFASEEVNTFALAQRIAVQSFVFPTQSKYAHAIPAAGVPGEKEKAHG